MNKSVAIIGTRGYPSYYGGFETAVRRLSPYLADRGWTVSVYGRRGDTKPQDPRRDNRVVSVDTWGVGTPSLSTLSYGFTSVLHAIRHKPDVALVMNVANGFWLPLLRAASIPTIVNVDGIEWERAKWGKLAKLVFKIGARLTATFATELVADARAIAERWKKDFHRSSLFIPYGGEVPSSLPVERGLNHRGYILAVARFVPENTIGEFFDAVELLADKYPVVVVGSSGPGGFFEARAAEMQDRLANFHWLGHISDDSRLHALWQHAGVYFHGHSVGGTNPALVQAMACGAPTLARDTVYNREVLGDTATFVEASAPKIACALDRAMQEAPGVGVSRIRERAIEVYSWESVCMRYEQALLAHLPGAGPSRAGRQHPPAAMKTKESPAFEGHVAGTGSNTPAGSHSPHVGTLDGRGS